MHIVVNTPNSHIGRPLTEALLAAGQQVTIINRNPDNVADLVGKGAQLVTGSIDDAAVLDAAFAGADALFWLTPPVFRPDYLTWVDQTTALATEAAKRHGIARAVVLSSLGADKGPDSGPVGQLFEVEEAFRRTVAHVTALRPGWFMENLLNDLPTIVTTGAIYSSLPADKSGPWVATRDIGHKAAEVLLDTTWSGHRVVGVHGPVDLTFRQATEIVAQELGRPVGFVQVTHEQLAQGMRDAGIPDFVVDLYTPMYRAIAENRMESSEPRSAETTTPTTLATFVREVLAPAMTGFKAPAGVQ